MIEIDETLLIRLAGVNAFGRGLHYFEEGRVGDVESTAKATTAIVRGNHQFNVRLRHTHRMIEGACDCPASDGIDFCKHCVAVALVLHERQDPPKSMDKRSALRRIRRYFSQQSQEELIEELMCVVNQDRKLRNDLLEKVQFVSEELPYSKLKKMIRDAMPSEELWGYRETRAYFRRVESMLARISESSGQLSPLVLLRAAEYAIRRLDHVLESIDDPGDCCEAPMEMLLDLHLSVISRLGWTLSELASYLVDRSLADYWHPFQYDPYLYADRIGGDFRVTISAEIDSRLNALPKVPVGGVANREQTGLLLAQLQEQLHADVGG